MVNRQGPPDFWDGVVKVRTLVVAVLVLGSLWFVASIFPWVLPITLDQTLAAEAGIAAVAGLGLAALAAVVAVLAYREATGRPKLNVWIRLPANADSNKPYVEVPVTSGDTGKVALEFRLTRPSAEVYVANASAYAARNPAVRITFLGFNLKPQERWTSLPMTGPLERGERAIQCTLQWDGGTNLPIHGGQEGAHWGLPLPTIDLRGAVVDVSDKPAVRIEAVADGYVMDVTEIDVDVRRTETRRRPLEKAHEGVGDHENLNRTDLET